MKNARMKVKDNVNFANVLGKKNYYKTYFCFKLKINLINYFIGEAINQFLNTNANELVQEMRPAASQSIAKLFKGFLEAAFSHIPINTWLLE